MIVRNLSDCKNSHRRITSHGWESIRLLLREDDVGFSFHITTIYKDAILNMHYKNHYESVYCISGEGKITLESTGEVFRIKPGTIYILNNHDKHILHAETELQLACVFNPALRGNEVHDESGSYPVLTDVMIEA